MNHKNTQYLDEKTLLHLFIQNNSSPALLLDRNGIIRAVNDAFSSLVNASNEQLKDRNYFSWCHSSKIQPVYISLDELNETLISRRYAQSQYDQKIIVWSVHPIPHTEGDLVLLLGFDISPFYSTTNQNQYVQRSIIDLIPNHHIFWKNKELVYLGCNKTFSDSLGLSSPSEIIGKTDYDLPTSKEQSDLYRANDTEILNSKLPKLNIEEHQTVAGNLHKILLTSKVPFYNEQGEIAGIIGIYSDITQQKMLEESLKNAKEQAEAANRAKTEFLANMSHDIRTPLTGVIGLSEILENTLTNPDEQEKAHLLHDSGEELLHLLNDILDDVQAENFHSQDVKKQSFDLHQCIRELIRLESPATSLKHLELKERIASDVPRYIYSDRNKIQRILLNLLGNAIKFTQTGSITLEIDCLHADDSTVHLKFGVSDTGIGIPEEAQAQVFNRFFKVSSSYKGIYTGHGLGLHIVQSYVTLLGGHITLTSKVGIGSTFNFDMECELGTAPVENHSVPVSKTAAAPLQGPIHLLLVEDNEIALKTLEFLLSKKGYTFSSAGSGEDALALFHERPFDLMVTDIGLPGISGNELSQLIRAQSSIPIIGLTGHAEGAAKEECFNSGINEVFSKPAQIELLHEGIQKLTKKASPQLTGENSNHPPNAPLGLDLPDAENELFKIEHFSLLDIEDALNNCGSNQTILIDMLTLMVAKEVPTDLEQMKQAYAAKDYDQIEKTAHKIKGSAVYVGTIRMKMACQYVERYWKTGERTLFEPLYLQAVRVIEDTIAYVDLWLKKQAIK